MTDHEASKLAVFEGKWIRKILHNGSWWFVVEDVVLALIESRDPKQYIQQMKQRDPELGKGWVQIVHTLPIPTVGGLQKLNCANTEGLFRLIQSIPSPKTEPFKRWLARVGKERIDELENPELAMARMQGTFGLKVDDYNQAKDLQRENRRHKPQREPHGLSAALLLRRNQPGN